MLVFGAWMVPQPAEAQFSGAAVYELGIATTDVGENQGNASLAYGFGVGGTYSFFSANSVELVVGADLLVRSFGVDLPDRIQRDAGVFDQTDLILDQLVALRFRRILAGLYLEQRRIDRGTALGTLGFPASAVGLVVDAPLGSGDRTGVRFSYARFRSGRLRLQGSAIEPEVDSGRSVRVSVRHYFSNRWGFQGEYADIKLVMDPLAPTFTFFNHRQRTATFGATLSF